MLQPKTFLIRMGVFLLAGLIIAAALKDQVRAALMANVYLNGAILAVLAIGLIYAFRRVTDLRGEVHWLTNFKRKSVKSVDKPPRLLAPAAALLSKGSDDRMQLNTLSMRSVLDGLASRLEESREISRYLTGLLVFLGLLGTFWGLLGTIGAMGDTIEGLSVDTSDLAVMFDELKSGLEAPLDGMAIAFSSSLFGLAGSLMLGFMDLQATQAQTRFYNDVEDWLASVTHLGYAGDEREGKVPAAVFQGAGPNGYIAALMEQTADGLDKLSRTMSRTDEGRQTLQEGMSHIASAISRLTDRMAESSAQDEAHRTALTSALSKLGDAGKTQTSGLDEGTKDHIRNMDITLKQLVQEQSRASEMMIDELRSEIKLLSRTLAATLEGLHAANVSAHTKAPAHAGGEAGVGAKTASSQASPAQPRPNVGTVSKARAEADTEQPSHPFLKIGAVPRDRGFDDDSSGGSSGGGSGGSSGGRS